ncbi:MAG: pyruvate kinase [Polyangiaceae bacterium]
MNRLQSEPPPNDLAALLSAGRELVNLDQRLSVLEREMHESVEAVPLQWRESALNLVHYVALRQHDLRQLQSDLAALGISSLGHSESCVRNSLRQALQRVRDALSVRGEATAQRELDELTVTNSITLTREAAAHYLHNHTREVLGPPPNARHIYIMVTAPPAKEADQAWMATMLRSGMNVLRVNCAHEGPEEWLATLKALGQARRESGRECRVLMDLAGPKIRTGAIAADRHIATWKPTKDELGQVTIPAQVVLQRASAPTKSAGAVLTLSDEAFACVREGDELCFRDARGSKRRLTIHEVGSERILAQARRRAYLLDRVTARVIRNDRKCSTLSLEVLGGEGAAIDVRVGDELLLTAQRRDGRPPRRGPSGSVIKRGLVACTLPAALDQLEAGQRVLFDDGRIECLVKKAKKTRGTYVLSVVRTQKQIAKLRAEKGINLPDTVISVPALTEDDLRALAFIAEHADAVSLSFVKDPADLRALHAELDRLGKPGLGVVLKIETRVGFENLPRLLLEGLRRPPLAVMIARGDLAVEVGFERLAELQEEILWLCEACHVPAIWATQVLDTLARTGVPSRAEVTDAAASVAAECVMLNKGPFVDVAVRALSDILHRMEKHHYKKRSLFRRLKVSTFAER